MLFLLLFIPSIKGCFHPKPKIITFIDLAAMPPAAVPVSEPEPPPPQPKPKPALTNTPPKVIKLNPKKTEPKPTPKPVPKKTEAERLAEIRQNKRVAIPNPQTGPKLDFSGIKSALNSASTGSGSGSGSGVYSPFAGYYDSVKQRMYAVWQQPAGAPIGLTATATIRVECDGAVSRKSIARRSGNESFDQSVQNALNAITRLPVPPVDLPSRDIQIEFVLSQ